MVFIDDDTQDQSLDINRIASENYDARVTCQIICAMAREVQSS